MLPEVLLPDPESLRIETVEFDSEQTTMLLTVSCTTPSACCPLCQQASTSIHSHYTRTLTDLPCLGWQTRLIIQVRRFFCHNPLCRQRIFTERLPNITTPWSRRTQRLAHVQEQLALAVGGIASERLAHLLQLPTSLDTFLRLIRRRPTTEHPTPHVLGVDDWAIRKGHQYGTLLVDLETHEPVDVLPDRTTESLRTWLETHPGVAIISRDRAGNYAEGARLGAPHALQVADRWHILKNLGEALTKILDNHRRQLQQLPALPLPATPLTPSLTLDEIEQETKLTPSQQARQAARRQQRLERFEAVQDLFQQGWSLSAIAAYLGLDRKTVRKYAHADTFPERQPRSPQASLLDPYKSYVWQRWHAGCRNAAQLLREIREQGYRGGNTVLRQFIAHMRKALHLPPRTRMIRPAQTLSENSERPMTPRRATWLILQAPDQITDTIQDQIDHMRTMHPNVDSAISLTQDFANMLRTRTVSHLDTWLEAATDSGLPPLRSFANGIRRDYDAVRAGLELEWSTGQVEGQINRLKFIKRQMYGRANFDLLRLRVLHTA